MLTVNGLQYMDYRTQTTVHGLQHMDYRGVNNRLCRLGLGCPINRSLMVSYSTRLRGIKVELQLVQVHLLLFTRSLSTIQLTNYFSEVTWSRVLSNM